MNSKLKELILTKAVDSGMAIDGVIEYSNGKSYYVNMKSNFVIEIQNTKHDKPPISKEYLIFKELLEVGHIKFEGVGLNE